MKKLEPGMLCRITCGRGYGKIVTLIRFIGDLEPKRHGRVLVLSRFTDWWETDGEILSDVSELGIDPVFRAAHLQPIKTDHQPADEEWQADFKRLLSGNKQPARQPN